MREKREVVQELMARGLSERAACQTVGLSRSTQRYQPRDRAARRQLGQQIRELAQRHRRYGYRRITALLRRQGEHVNHKRVWAIWKEERLSLPRRRPRKRRKATSGERRKATSGERPQTAVHRNQVWTYDFLFDRTERGQTLKILMVLTEYTRQCQVIRVGRRLDSGAVIDTLADLFRRHGGTADRPSCAATTAGSSARRAWRRGWRDKVPYRHDPH